jgi:bacitracin transport system permease protein
MIKLIRAEIAKMKRSTMFAVSFAGAAVTPFVTFTGYLLYGNRHPEEIVTVERLLSETSLYMAVLIGTPLFGVLAAWLFNREFEERTLRSVLSVPVSRAALFFAKLAVLVIWILVLSSWAWLLSLVLCLVGEFPGGSFEIVSRYFFQFVENGLLLFLLMGPIVFVTFLFRSYVPVIVFAVCLTLVSVVVGNSEYRSIYPWTAILPIISGKYPPEYPRFVPFLSISIATIGGYAASFLSFRRMDIP